MLRSKKDFFVHRLPSAKEVFTSLKNFCDKEPVWISDLFPHDYLYKPLVFDLVEIHNDDEYKVLKKIKQARYIHADVWKEDRKGKSLIHNILDGEIVVDNEFISPVLYRRSMDLKKELHPEYQDPIVYNVQENTQFDVLFGSDLETKYNICEKRFFEIAGNEFEIISVEPIIQKQGTILVLQAEDRVNENYQVSACSKSIFRVRYAIQDRIQLFKAGSVFVINDCSSTERPADMYPFVIFMEE